MKSRMTLAEALEKSKAAKSQDLQPEGAEVAEAFLTNAFDGDTAPYLIAFLLHTLNEQE